MKPSASAQKMKVHQFHYSAAGGDAITGQMLFIREALRKKGITGEVFARDIKGTAAEVVLPFSGPAALWDCDLLMIHHGSGNPLLKELLKLEIPKALVYHNITPSQFFTHDPHVAHLCDEGRSQLSLFKGALAASFADSKYNASELEAVGIYGSQILPLFDLSEEASISTHRPVRKQGRQFLFVGRIAPHKNQRLLLEILAHYRRAFDPKAQLTLVGTQDPIYGHYLRLLAQALGIESAVNFAGKVTQKALNQAYRNADAFVCTSLHEGYCIPLVEAMRFNVPVFSFANTGMKETLGDGGVELKTDSPETIAQILSTILDKKENVETLVRGQRERLAELGRIQSSERVQNLCMNLLQKLRANPHRIEAASRRKESHAPPTLN